MTGLVELLPSVRARDSCHLAPTAALAKISKLRMGGGNPMAPSSLPGWSSGDTLVSYQTVRGDEKEDETFLAIEIIMFTRMKLEWK